MILPDIVRSALGLDDAPHWIVVSEANEFSWPGPDVRPIPGRRPTTFVYGTVPPGLLRSVVNAYLENRRRGRAKPVVRSE